MFKNSLKFLIIHWKTLVPGSLLKKRLWQRCFPVNFEKILRTPFSQNTFGWLLLNRAQRPRNFHYGKSSNNRPPSFKRLPPINAPRKISLWTPPSFKRPSLPRGVFIRKMKTYLCKPTLCVGSRYQLDIIIYRRKSCHFLWKSRT